MIKPYLKWVGSKYKLFAKLREFLPTSYVNYYEPFVGSASLFLNIINDSDYDMFSQKQGAYYLRDINKNLINCHLVVAYKMEALTKKLHFYEKKESEAFDMYNEERRKTAILSQFGENVTAAARFIYLNRRAYGGMWRENKSGVFNVPKCESQTFSLITEEFMERLKYCSRLLKRANISCGKYHKIAPTKGDFVLFDPPYYPASSSSNFTSYTKTQWDDEQHKQLFDYIDSLNERGVKFLMTNSDTPYVVERCSKYNTHSHSVKRFIDALKYRDGSKKQDGRDQAQELIIWNY